MNSSPKISIVIPSYNKVNFIGKTLESIFSQKYSNLEVVVQDGSSTDGTQEVIRKYIKKYPKQILFESKKDKGQTDAINKGFRKANGNIITFINADDTYEMDTFKTISEYYKKFPKSLWFAGKGRVIDEEDREVAQVVTMYKSLLLTFNSYIMLLIVNYLMQPSIFLTRKSYKKYGEFIGVGKAVLEYDKWLTIGKDEMPVIINKNLSNFRLYRSAFSSSETEKILAEDLKITNKYTSNKFILILHQLHNIARKVLAK